MPDASGNIKGSGWTRKREEGYTRAFGSRGDLSNFKGVMADFLEGCVHEVPHPLCPYCSGSVMPVVDHA